MLNIGGVAIIQAHSPRMCQSGLDRSIYINFIKYLFNYVLVLFKLFSMDFVRWHDLHHFFTEIKYPYSSQIGNNSMITQNRKRNIDLIRCNASTDRMLGQ